MNLQPCPDTEKGSQPERLIQHPQIVSYRSFPCVDIVCGLRKCTEGSIGLKKFALG